MLFLPVLLIEKIDRPSFDIPDDAFDRYELELDYYTELIQDHVDDINEAIGESMYDVYTNPDSEYHEPYETPSTQHFYVSDFDGIFEPLQEFQNSVGYGSPESSLLVYELETGAITVWLKTDNVVSPDVIMEHFQESGLDETVDLFGAEFSGIELLKKADPYMFEIILSGYADNLGYDVD